MDQNIQKIRPLLNALLPGQSVTFPLVRMKSVRAQASELGMIYNRKYATRTDRELQVIIVKRVL